MCAVRLTVLHLMLITCNNCVLYCNQANAALESEESGAAVAIINIAQQHAHTAAVAANSSSSSSNAANSCAAAAAASGMYSTETLYAMIIHICGLLLHVSALHHF